MPEDDAPERHGQTMVTVVPPWPVLLGLAAGCATFAGGRLALRVEQWSGLLLGTTAGMVLGVALFDLLPDAIAIGGSRPGSAALLTVTGLALIGYMLIDRLADHRWPALAGVRSALAPASLTMHSFIDGAGIGLAFQLAPSVGWLVAIAVIAHDLADGVNAVSLAGATGNRRAAEIWLVINALAPVAGALVGGALTISPPLFAMLLCAFAGIFLYIGAAHLLPRSHALRPQASTGFASMTGMLFMLCVVQVARSLH